MGLGEVNDVTLKLADWIALSSQSAHREVTSFNLSKSQVFWARGIASLKLLFFPPLPLLFPPLPFLFLPSPSPKPILIF